MVRNWGLSGYDCAWCQNFNGDVGLSCSLSQSRTVAAVAVSSVFKTQYDQVGESPIRFSVLRLSERVMCQLRPVFKINHPIPHHRSRVGLWEA